MIRLTTQKRETRQRIKVISPKKIAGLLAIALCAIGVSAASASAATPPEFLHCVAKSGGKFESGCMKEKAGGGFEKEAVKAGSSIAFTDKSGESVLHSAKHESVICKADTSTGDVTGPKGVGSVVVKYTGCTQDKGTLKCHSIKKPETEEGTVGVEEEIITNTLSGEIYFLHGSTSTVLQDLKPASGFTRFVTIKCGTGNIAVLGSVIGEASPTNTFSTAGELKFEANAGGTAQKFVFLENGTTEDHLEAFAEPAWLVVVGGEQITFSEKIEVSTTA